MPLLRGRERTNGNGHPNGTENGDKPGHGGVRGRETHGESGELGVGEPSLSSSAEGATAFLDGVAAAEVVAAVPFTLDADRGDAVDGRMDRR